jgi:hypothetical protein
MIKVLFLLLMVMEAIGFIMVWKLAKEGRI